MPVITAPKLMDLARAKDIKVALINEVGDLSKVRVMGQNLFIANYVGPEKTKGGIFLSPETKKEDEWQGNTGLVLKVGEGIDEEDASDFLHQWVMFGGNDGLRYHYNGVAVRTMHIDRVRQIIPDPEKVRVL